jgi:hypothetical protein
MLPENVAVLPRNPSLMKKLLLPLSSVIVVAIPAGPQV